MRREPAALEPALSLASTPTDTVATARAQPLAAPTDWLRRLAAEFIGTALLVAVVVGSGIMAERLSAGNDGLALLANSLATAGGLIVLILIFGPVSGAHFNPAVTLAMALGRRIGLADAASYIVTQCLGAIAGTMLAHSMFDLDLLQWGVKPRGGAGAWIAEAVATFGLLGTILGCLAARKDALPYAVGLYIGAGYWFTASTSFANPAVTLARSFTRSFTGIAPADAPGFVLAQLAGAGLALGVFGWLLGGSERGEARRSG